MLYFHAVCHFQVLPCTVTLFCHCNSTLSPSHRRDTVNSCLPLHALLICWHYTSAACSRCYLFCVMGCLPACYISYFLCVTCLSLYCCAPACPGCCLFHYLMSCAPLSPSCCSFPCVMCSSPACLLHHFIPSFHVLLTCLPIVLLVP